MAWKRGPRWPDAELPPLGPPPDKRVWIILLVLVLIAAGLEVL